MSPQAALSDRKVGSLRRTSATRSPWRTPACTSPVAVRAASVRNSSWGISRSPYLTIGPPMPVSSVCAMGCRAFHHTGVPRIDGMGVPRALAVVVAAALAGPAVGGGGGGPGGAAGLAGSAPAAAHVLHVGPGQRFARPCQAIAAAHAGDTIEIDARGTYRGDV